MVKIKDDRYDYQLSTGRKVYANAGILGICPGMSTDGVYYGYDGGVSMSEEWMNNENHWTAEEKRELADYVIALWTDWKERIR